MADHSSSVLAHQLPFLADHGVGVTAIVDAATLPRLSDDADGVTWATRMRSATLYKVLAALLVLIAAALAVNHFGPLNPLTLATGPRIFIGVVAGFGIGTVAAIMGVAGGELLIPAIVLLFAVDIKTAGSLSLAVSLPTMLVAFARYSRDASFYRATPQCPLSAGHGRRLDHRGGDRRSALGDRARQHLGAAARDHPADLRSQGLAALDMCLLCAPDLKTPALTMHLVHRSGRSRMLCFGHEEPSQREGQGFESPLAPPS